jgi:hypothetical protein
MSPAVVPTLALAVASMLGAMAARADDLPAGWSARADATLVHEQSGTTCPPELAGFKRVQIDSKGAPDLGVCTYAGNPDLEGLIRVRQYVRGAGETPLAIQNDQTLMEPPPGSPQIVSAIRSGPGPEGNGAATQQFVITKKRNGLLVDCIGRQPRSDTGKGASDFALACLKHLGE